MNGDGELGLLSPQHSQSCQKAVYHPWAVVDKDCLTPTLQFAFPGLCELCRLVMRHCCAVAHLRFNTLSKCVLVPKATDNLFVDFI